MWVVVRPDGGVGSLTPRRPCGRLARDSLLFGLLVGYGRDVGSRVLFGTFGTILSTGFAFCFSSRGGGFGIGTVAAIVVIVLFFFLLLRPSKKAEIRKNTLAVDAR